LPHIPSQPSDLIKERFAVLLDIGRTVTGTLRPDQLYATIYRQTTRVLRMDGFCITLFDARTGTGTCGFYASGGVVHETPACTDPLEDRSSHVSRPMIYPPGETSPFFRSLESDTAGRTTMTAPLRRELDVLGTITVLSPVGVSYDASELELLEAVADLAAVAIRNARVIAEVDRSRMEAERLEEIGLALSSTLELPRVLERVTRAARDLTNADSATVWLLRGSDFVEVAYASGEAAPLQGTLLPVPLELYERMRMRRQPMVFDSTSSDKLPESVRTITPNRSSMAVPLVTDDELIGALSIAHTRQRIYSAEDVRLLERIGFQASVAVANARLHEEVRALSLTDPLTGLPNRRHLDLFLDKEVAAAKRGRKVAVLLFDIDDFKDYNDAAGHEAGDEALRAFASVLASQTRAMNLAARLGGDEFVTVLTDSDRRGAVAHAQRVARSIEAHELLSRIGMRATIGIATFLQRMTTPADLIRAADMDMYRRKTGSAKAIWA
jgi:diguanylate cyclase (GGDEF)-like protein